MGFAVSKIAQAWGALGVSKGGGGHTAAYLDELRTTLRARVDALRLEREEAEKILATRRAAAAAGIISRGDTLGNLRVENRALEAKTPAAAMKIRRDALQDDLFAAKLLADNTQKDRYNTADPEKQKAADDAAIAYEMAKNKLLTFDQNNKPGMKSGSPAQLTERERIGAGISSPVYRIQTDHLNVAKRSEVHLKEIRDKIANPPPASGDTVRF